MSCSPWSDVINTYRWPVKLLQLFHQPWCFWIPQNIFLESDYWGRTKGVVVHILSVKVDLAPHKSCLAVSLYNSRECTGRSAKLHYRKIYFTFLHMFVTECQVWHNQTYLTPVQRQYSPTSCVYSGLSRANLSIKPINSGELTAGPGHSLCISCCLSLLSDVLTSLSAFLCGFTRADSSPFKPTNMPVSLKRR